MLHGWCHVKCCRFGASSVYTIQPCTRLQCHFVQSHIGRVYACLAVTCHLHFWHNDGIYALRTMLPNGLVVRHTVLPPRCASDLVVKLGLHPSIAVTRHKPPSAHRPRVRRVTYRTPKRTGGTSYRTPTSLCTQSSWESRVCIQGLQ